MMDKSTIIKMIHEAFAHGEYPGDDYLIGSTEGMEPFEEIEPFKGQQDWAAVDPHILDQHSGALSFFSEAGLRFFLPAYLIADLNEELLTADPLFTLTHGFSDLSVEHQIGSRVFIRKTGKNAFINPLRYGAITFFDYARYRLSVFSREEATAIVAYLKVKRDKDQLGIEKKQITAALNLFWIKRVEDAPKDDDIAAHLQEGENYLSELNSELDNKN